MTCPPAWLKRFDRKWIIVVAIGLGLSLAVPYTVDFHTFYDAGRMLLIGRNPYLVEWFLNPLHVAILFAPLAILPFEVAYRLQAGLAFVIYVVAMWRLLDRRWDLTWLALMSPFAWLIAFYGNIDWLVLLGATLPPPIGVWLVLAKPQEGLVVASVMLWEEWRVHGWQRVVLIVSPIALVLAVSLLLEPAQSSVVAQPWNISAWPYGLVVGVPLAIVALQRRDRKLGLLASPFLSPYVSALNWSVALPAGLRSRRWAVVAVILSWALVLIWRSRI